MIRPFTCLCALLAGLSGLYLYTEKHRTTLLDQQISNIVANTQATRERTALLRAEWTLLNQTDRLSALDARFLPNLRPITTAQLVPLSALSTRLPPVGPETPPHPILTPATAPNLVGQAPAAVLGSNSPTLAPDSADMVLAHADTQHREAIHPPHGGTMAAHRDSVSARARSQSEVARLKAADEVRRVWSARAHSPMAPSRTPFPTPQAPVPYGSSLGSAHTMLAAPVPPSNGN